MTISVFASALLLIQVVASTNTMPAANRYNISLCEIPNPFQQETQHSDTISMTIVKDLAGPFAMQSSPLFHELFDDYADEI